MPSPRNSLRKQTALKTFFSILIAGLMARGNDALGAASIAAYLHARAARAFGPGLIAEDLPENLPKALQKLRKTDS